MITKVFTEEIGRNVKVYVDDIVVKSEKVKEHINDLAGVFNVLRKLGVKLNPERYVFGISPGKFLRFMVS